MIIQDLDQLSFGWHKKLIMKYKKHIIFFLFINLIIVFLSIFVANLSRKIELENTLIEQNINKYKEQLKINKIEFSFYNNPDYLKKLYNIYFSYDEKNIEEKIISFSNISILDKKSVIIVTKNR